MEVLSGLFYEFHRYRVISRAGQPIVSKTNIEVGPSISRVDAINQVRNGKDVYTLKRTDAEKLAISVYGEKPRYDAPTQNFHFQHFHPGGEHPVLDKYRQGRPRAIEGPGHVFFGARGENQSVPHLAR